MGNQVGNCTNCGGCCTTFCSRTINASCYSCPCSGAGAGRANQTLLAGMFVGFNSLNELVPYYPLATDTDLHQTKDFVGVSVLTVVTDQNGDVTNQLNSLITAKRCPKNRIPYESCGKWTVDQIQPYNNYSAVDLIDSVIALHLGVWIGVKKNEQGAFRLY
jgi:hypothetical protein